MNDSEVNSIISNISEKKTRGRKKNVSEVPEVKKKRGRKKKWEVETTNKLIDNNPIIFNVSKKNDESDKTISSNYEQKEILFGNLNIKVHSNKDSYNTENILTSLKNNNLNVDVKYKPVNLKMVNNNSKKVEFKSIKIMNFYKDSDNSGKEIYLSNFRCYNCHHQFKNKPFFLPIDYCPTTNRYKITGNFCSPNCVKSYAHNDIIYSKKIHLVGEMYKKLFGYNYLIKFAPPIQILKDYGGSMTIEEYRESFNLDKKYCLKKINCKIITDEIMIK